MATSTSEAVSDVATWLGLVPGSSPSTARLPVHPGICAGTGSLHGGSGLAAGVVALEAATGRPLVWATAQYGHRARPGEELAITVDEIATGRRVTQARARMTAEGREVVAVSGALGERPVEGELRWGGPPPAPPPEECPLRIHHRPHVPSVNHRLEVRIARGRSVTELPAEPLADGRSALWCRVPGLTGTSAASLALVADVVTVGISSALGRRVGGRSLDNTIRIVDPVPTEWVLLDVRLHALHAGSAHGTVLLWSRAGALLAVASQSAAVRAWDTDPAG